MLTKTPMEPNLEIAVSAILIAVEGWPMFHSPWRAFLWATEEKPSYRERKL
jgi:hypothetical protein